MTTGLILFAHGARDPRWRDPFERLLGSVSDAHPGPVSLGFLEFMSPSLMEAAGDLVRRGATRIVVVPLFLAVGGHIRQDLPPLIAQATQRCGVPISTLDPAGEDSGVQAALAAYCLQGASQATF